MGQAEDAALIAAAQKGDEAAVRAALGKGANIKCKDGVRTCGRFSTRMRAANPPAR